MLLLSLLPGRWLSPWSTRVSEIVYLPLVPLGDVATYSRRWLRSESSEVPSSEEIEQLVIERNDYRRRFHAANATIAELEIQIRELSRMPLGADGLTTQIVHANVVARSPERLGGPVRINAGTRRGVHDGAIAVHNGDAIAGRVLGNPGPTTAFILPVFGENRLIDGVMEIDGEDVPVQLESANGGFLSSVDRSVMAKAGTVVRLHDSSWPRSAQGMRIAVVSDVRPRESNPNRLELRLKPVADPNELSRVLIVVEHTGQEGELP